MRLDRALSMQAGGFSRSRLQSAIRAGRVQVDGRPSRPSEVLRHGAVVNWQSPPPEPSLHAAPEDIPLEVLFEDDDLLVINKPSGLVVHPAPGNPTGTLVSALLHHCGRLSTEGETFRPGIVHRLDKETSGCLVAAKNERARLQLSNQFAAREVEKVYLAICHGTVRRLSGRIDAPISRHPKQRKKMAIAPGERGRHAVTLYRQLARVDGLSLIECQLLTGRTHQIRVHLKSLGAPVAGDALYGKRGHFSRQMLHAWKLAFRHPASGEHIEFRAPPPPEFNELFARAIRNQAL